MLAQGNPVMAKANKVMDIFYLDEQERKRYEAAWEYESDRLSMISESERKDLERGSRQKALETAKTMLTMGYPLGDICKIVGLPQAEVEALK
ncbi:Rpn family recombination-promoting nuclease/putative transposase [Treponema sp. OMZ 857]|uniref:Rpn family recombination-promoting nuclease/putative transposase n=1 Tax=Treponema sp. OMZ 857 TaxID=1643513 RepID=UPI0020A4FC8C|nr:Rpn family recombination-promoting nuclease/putative transposase [Treponema sp. OMZ 857]